MRAGVYTVASGRQVIYGKFGNLKIQGEIENAGECVRGGYTILLTVDLPVRHSNCPWPRAKLVEETSKLGICAVPVNCAYLQAPYKKRDTDFNCGAPLNSGIKPLKHI